mmetsp:Transcript_35522/g.94529  ORF Transcript_35522/g.94529 Transcript_35522/m.94529 type:complete len:204 (+) Transcript_35522:167-778(+)
MPGCEGHARPHRERGRAAMGVCHAAEPRSVEGQQRSAVRGGCRKVGIWRLGRSHAGLHGAALGHGVGDEFSFQSQEPRGSVQTRCCGVCPCWHALPPAKSRVVEMGLRSCPQPHARQSRRAAASGGSGGRSGGGCGDAGVSPGSGIAALGGGCGVPPDPGRRESSEIAQCGLCAGVVQSCQGVQTRFGSSAPQLRCPGSACRR